MSEKTKHYVYYHSNADLSNLRYDDHSIEYVNLDELAIPTGFEIPGVSVSKARQVYSEYLGIMQMKPTTDMVGTYTYSIAHKFSRKMYEDLHQLGRSDDWMLPPITFDKLPRSYDKNKLYGAYFRPYIFNNDFTNKIINELENTEYYIANEFGEPGNEGPFNGCVVVSKERFLKFQSWFNSVTSWVLEKYGAYGILMNEQMTDCGVGKNYTDNDTDTLKYRYHSIGMVQERLMAYYFARTVPVEDRVDLKQYLNTTSKRRLVTFSSPSHDTLKEKYFLPSIQDDFDIHVANHKQTCATGAYFESGWKESMMFKVDLILDTISNTWGDWFIYSDVDVQFFGKIEPILSQCIENYDIVLQNDHVYPKCVPCAGFFACKCNNSTMKLFNDVKQYMYNHPEVDDQGALINLLLDENYNNGPLRWKLLPEIFYSIGSQPQNFLKLNEKDIDRIYTQGNAKCLQDVRLEWNARWRWTSEDILTPENVPDWVDESHYRLHIPSGIVMHHANWTSGTSNKISQLEYVRKHVNYTK